MFHIVDHHSQSSRCPICIGPNFPSVTDEQPKLIISINYSNLTDISNESSQHQAFSLREWAYDTRELLIPFANAFESFSFFSDATEPCCSVFFHRAYFPAALISKYVRDAGSVGFPRTCKVSTCTCK